MAIAQRFHTFIQVPSIDVQPLFRKENSLCWRFGRQHVAHTFRAEINFWHPVGAKENEQINEKAKRGSQLVQVSFLPGTPVPSILMVCCSKKHVMLSVVTT